MLLAINGATTMKATLPEDIMAAHTAGPDPFTPVKGEGWQDEVRLFAVESLRLLKAFASVT
jgi:hypothetical protein